MALVLMHTYRHVTKCADGRRPDLCVVTERVEVEVVKPEQRL